MDALGERLFDANRTIGQPTKLATIFGRKITKRHRGKLETIIEDLDLPNPVIRSYYRDGSIKQYVRDHRLLRTEATSNNVRDFGVPKAIDHVPAMGQALPVISTDIYSNSGVGSRIEAFVWAQSKDPTPGTSGAMFWNPTMYFSALTKPSLRMSQQYSPMIFTPIGANSSSTENHWRCAVSRKPSRFSRALVFS